MAKEPKVSILITARDAASKVIDSVKSNLTGFGRSTKSMFASLTSSVSGFATVLAALGAGRLMASAVDEALAAERAARLLRDSVERLGFDYGRLAPQIGAYVDAQARAAALDNDEVAAALATLITRSGNLTGSMKNLNAVLGLAKKEHMDLSSAADIVGRAMGGNLRQLKQLGIDTKDTGEAIRRLRAQYAGFAEQEAQSFEGAQNRMKVAWGNLLEAGGKVITQSPTLRAAMANMAATLDKVSGAIERQGEAQDVAQARFEFRVAYFKAGVTIILNSIGAAILEFASVIARVPQLVGWAMLQGVEGLNKLGAALGRLPGVGKRLAFTIDTRPFEENLARARAAVTAATEGRENLVFGIREAIEKVGDKSLLLTRARRRAADAASGPPMIPGVVVTGPTKGDNGDKDRAKADQARTKEIAGLLQLLKLRELNAAGMAHLAALQVELTREVERERAAVERGRGSYARLAALEQQRRELAGAVNAARDEERTKELATLTALLELRKIDGVGLARALELQREVTREVTAEAARIREGVGDRERLVTLLKQQADLEARLGKQAPPKVQTGTTGPKPAVRLAIDNPRDRALLDTGGDREPDWLKRVRDGYDGITDAALAARAATFDFRDSLETLAGGALRGFTDAGLAAFEQIGNGTKAMGQAFGEAVRSGIATASKAEGRFWFYKGVGALGEGIFGSPKGFAAAAKYFAAAAGFMALGNLAGGGEARGGGGGGGRDTRERSGIEALGGSGRGKITLYMPDGASVFDPNDPRMVEAWRRMLSDLTDRDVIVVPRSR